MDRIYFFIRKWFGILIFISAQTIVLMPILICLNGIRSSDTLSNEKCSLPLKISYVQNQTVSTNFYFEFFLKIFFSEFQFRLPFKVDSLSVYLIMSTVSGLCIYAMAICKTMNAEIFYRYGLHLIARVHHLILHLNNISAQRL